MNLIIRNTNENAEPGAPKIFDDARVNEGTIFSIEFSNRGALVGYDLNKGIKDLAHNTGAREGITTYPNIESTDGLPELTAKKGFPMARLGNDVVMMETGITIKGVGSYLYSRQPKSVMIVWLEMDFTLANPEDFRSARILRAPHTEGGVLPFNVSVSLPSTINPYVSVFLAGKSGANNLSIGSSGSAQVAVEFTGPDTPHRIYLNGVLQGVGSQSEGEYGQPDSEDLLTIGGYSPSSETYGQPAVLYEATLHDLDVSGLTAQEVINQDYEYVNEIGRYEGKGTRRPYANIAQ